VTTVVVVDDEALIRSSLELILHATADLRVVATATGADAVDVVAEHRPDVVLLDVRMPDRDGLAVLADLVALPAPPAVAMLTTFDVDEYLGTAIAGGAAGFLLKDTHPEQLVQYVRTLAAGGTVLAPGLSRRLQGTPDRASTDSCALLVARLSPREADVLRLLATGATNAEIAPVLHVAPGTVKDAVSSLLRKLEVGTRVEAALVAERSGLLDGPG